MDTESLGMLSFCLICPGPYRPGASSRGKRASARQIREKRQKSVKGETFGKAQTQKVCGNTDTMLSQKAKHSEQECHEGTDTHCAKYLPHLEEKLFSRNDTALLIFLATICPKKKDG